ncbi:maltose permease [Purpureocillium lavendulum]|uniref:Maltose permease n=1 Tax=Purpureocillium lavendulum TaxID=1247861 RepID=A0AB34FXF4_9HYPO|nr:maltose permease [Purpureocillium lavendulum]
MTLLKLPHRSRAADSRNDIAATPSRLANDSGPKHAVELDSETYHATPVMDQSRDTTSPGDEVNFFTPISSSAADTLWLPDLSTDFDDTKRRIRRGLAADKEMTFLNCCRRYPKAVGWTLLLFLTVVLEAYGKVVISGLLAFPTFKRKYGHPAPSLDKSPDEDVFEIAPEWQIGLQNAAVTCEIIGLLAHGYITYIIGYRKVLVGSLIWLCVAIFPAFFAQNIGTLVASQALCGLSWGVIQTLAATYAAEVVPSGLRAHILSNVNMCWVVGQLFGTGILRIFVDGTTEWSYRIPFALQWAFALPLLIGVCFAPDSPWWLIRHERPDDARDSLHRLSNRASVAINDTIALMEHTNAIEKKLNYGGATYMDLFKGANRRRTEISCVVWVCQAISGAIWAGYAPYFFEQAGFNPANSFNLSIGMYGLAILGGMIAWGLLLKIGRRTLYLAGLASAVVLLVVGGTVSATMGAHSGALWALGAVIILATFTYDLTLGPVCYILVAEVPSTRLRVKTVALARVAYNIVMIVNHVLVLTMLNPTGWNLEGKVCFVYAGAAFICLIWCYFRLPETKGLSYLELDILFEKRAPAAKFVQLRDRLANSAYFSMTDADRLRNTWHGWLAYS